MCKTKKVFFIDSNNRNASSASGTDFTIDLDHPLTLPDGCGVAIDSLSLPDTSNITPIVTGINDKLYFSLDDGTTTTYSIITLPATNYSNEAMDILVEDIQMRWIMFTLAILSCHNLIQTALLVSTARLEIGLGTLALS